MTTEEEQTPAAGQEEKEPTKKKTSVKLVKRVKSKKSEKSDKVGVELTPPETIAENGSPKAVEESPKPTAAAAAAPVALEPVRRASSKKRVQRSGSNVFAMFSQNQVHTFKEAFGFIDQDKDGIISKSDIRATFDALGRLCSDKELEQMTSEAPGPINFTMFLTVFGDRIQGTDEEDVVVNAFGLFDEGDGFCQEDKLRHYLMTWGEKFSKQECDVLLQEAPVDSKNRIDVRKFAQLVTKGADDEEEQS